MSTSDAGRPQGHPDDDGVCGSTTAPPGGTSATRRPERATRSARRRARQDRAYADRRSERAAARARAAEARDAKGSQPRKPYPVWVVTAIAFVLPGGGQVLNADPIRGIIMQFFMMLLAFITYMVTSPDISYFGRFAGGFFIYIISVLDAYSIAKKRSRSWERICDGRQGQPAQS